MLWLFAVINYLKKKKDNKSIRKLKNLERYKNPDNDPRGDWASGGIDVGPIIPEKVYPITTPSGRVVYPPNGYCWRYKKEKFIELINDNRIWFGQLYGMSDNISYNLAYNGFNVAKYLPFGPVRDVMPYLIRRAEENTSVAGQTSRELTLIKKEKERRKL